MDVNILAISAIFVGAHGDTQGGAQAAVQAGTAAHPSAAHACGASAQLRLEPTQVQRGQIFTVHLSGVASGSIVTGAVAGEALHFDVDGTGSSVSYAPAPIDSQRVTVRVICSSGATRDTIHRVVSLGAGNYRIEHLRVAPRFSAPPNSAILERQRREAALATSVSTASHDTPRLFSQPFQAPRDSRVTSAFGGGREFNGTIASRHMGTDYAGAIGAPIRAVNRGVVRLVDEFYLGGKVIYIDHGAGLTTAYLHLSAHRVAVGDTVQRGTVLGLVGASGRVTGPHLHLIARYGAVTIDPQSLVQSTATIRSRRRPKP